MVMEDKEFIVNQFSENSFQRRNRPIDEVQPVLVFAPRTSTLTELCPVVTDGP